MTFTLTSLGHRQYYKSNLWFKNRHQNAEKTVTHASTGDQSQRPEDDMIESDTVQEDNCVDSKNMATDMPTDGNLESMATDTSIDVDNASNS